MAFLLPVRQREISVISGEEPLKGEWEAEELPEDAAS